MAETKEQFMDTGINGTEGHGTTAPASAQTPAAPAAGAEMVEMKRLTGALQKIEELTLLNRNLTERLTALTQSEGSLKADLAQKESLWSAQQSEFTQKLTSAEAEKATLTSRLAAADAMKLKMKIVGELNAPSLYGVLDVVPDSTDEALLRQALQKLAQFAGTIAHNREQELKTGITNLEKAPENNVQLPDSDEGWKSYVAKLPFGSPEYQQAMSAWHRWLFKS
jgi:hypothetical protein